ncbi:hypothetical protein ERJ75_000832900 [Trypanosoma vivax]|uniref:Uncharacterized protein n=1 Tax=Trypanosoma vivax (strain Y486) TaxID=1055687 RepID=G0TYY9_TRYVY|nr:hypothetical protein TRVL_00131 [Trypanosoma vivax]KAH8613130.1 hypothetical protein ERJ75_000832900 [Trypanosoma vivax]CCC49192.1 conserved hypothetical protein [Trypanosoma vivax Y486]
MTGPSRSDGHVSSASLGSDSMETTRNFVLGIPKGGVTPGSSDAASLQAAEAFIADIQREIIASDMANAEAMELYALSWWRRMPSLWKRQACVPAPTTAAHKVVAMGGSVKLEGVERVSEMDLRRRAAPPLNSWFFKLRHPGWVPLMQRRWVPFACMAGLVLVWTPDVWKLRALHRCDCYYSELRSSVHCWYWRVTMSEEDFSRLTKNLETGLRPSSDAAKCPL